MPFRKYTQFIEIGGNNAVTIDWIQKPLPYIRDTFTFISIKHNTFCIFIITFLSNFNFPGAYSIENVCGECPKWHSEVKSTNMFQNWKVTLIFRESARKEMTNRSENHYINVWMSLFSYSGIIAPNFCSGK